MTDKTDVVARMRDRLLVVHGGSSDVLYGWNLTRQDSEMHRDAIDELTRLRADVARLTDHLRKANSSAEHFEREWYLRGDEIERLEAEKAEAEASQIAALDLVSRIRFALGDNGKRMQDELIAYCAELKTLADVAMRGDREQNDD